MCNIQVNPNATAETIDKAFDKAQAQGSNYTLRFYVEADGTAWCAVTNIKTGAKYTVEIHNIFDECITCDCPEYKRNHFCKHCMLSIEEVQIREQEAIYSSIDGNVPEVKP
jgi:hypothetical protein